ncbi:uncharacterized protein [Drosophila kikkawai]|uniref:Uncharacterized protein n=1 Tax=Drosophila kikkawai TaxID=30033 RepID=A0A6P4I5P5_DROKI|nr:uncharacterized protein LOC108075514 [Drosophila kikkawai]
MSSHPLSLGKFAQRGATMYIYPVPSSFKCFYHSQRIAQRASERALPRKVIGVKKTLVNQMQGMVRSSDPSKLPAYKTYGKTRLFSSSSSLKSSSGSLSSRRCMSSGLKKPQQQQWEEDSKTETFFRNNRTTLSATQRGYNTSPIFGRGLATQAARDISRSIQEELMVVNDETRHMLNCNPNRHDRRDFQEQPNADPMQGWNHPMSYKTMPSEHDGIPEELELEARQNRPRRRQLIMGYASHAANVAARNRETLAKPPHSQQLNPNPKSKVGQLSSMYSSNAQERLSELRSPLTRYVPQATSEKDSDDGLMDVAIARATRADFTNARGMPRAEDEEPDSLYEQPPAERELLKQAFLRGTRHADQGRMDELHYESSAGIGSNDALISASRQVINQKFAGFQHLTSAQKWRAPQLVESVNPTPQLNPRAVSEARGSVLMQPGKRHSTARMSTKRLATPRFFGGLGESDTSTPSETGERKRDDNDDVSRNESWSRHQEQEPRDVEPPRAIKQNRVMASGPQRQRSIYQITMQDKNRRQSEMKARSRNVSIAGRMTTTKGEKRDHRPIKPEDLDPENDIEMPSEYDRKSAVQRLGPAIPAEYGTRAFNSY